jgi:hypothetical protein
MSWLSRRQTTRVEDIAYCMLGIFDINMPLLYGEGLKAFVRLQEEIIKVSNDHTLFCWSWQDAVVPSDWGSMIAPHPATFESADHFRQYDFGLDPISSYQMTNAGLRIELRTISAVEFRFATLNAMDVTSGQSVGIPLHQISADRNVYIRLPEPSSPVPLHFNPFRPLHEMYIQPKGSRNVGPRTKSFRYGILATFPRLFDFQILVNSCLEDTYDRDTSILGLAPVSDASGFHDGLLSLGLQGQGLDWVVYFAIKELKTGFFHFVQILTGVGFNDFTKKPKHMLRMRK